MGQIGGFFELWSPVLLLVVVVVGYVYHRFVTKGNGQPANFETVSASQRISFYSGLALFYIGQGSPINYIGHHYLFSMHMLQQTLLYLVVPILIWQGMRGWMLQPLMKNAIFRVVLTFFTRPLIALFLFNMLFSIYHMPVIMDYLMTNDLALFGYHTVLLFTAFMMWFPVFCPIDELNRLNDLKKMAYIFGNGVLLTPACALIIFADTIIYDMYANVTVPFPHLSPLDDQQLGGVLMKIVQEVVYGGVLAYIFFRWYRRERKDDDDMELTEVQEGLNNQGGNWNRA
ncbi:cytochrome c oxidase assembly protein [Paenibacillus sp. GCM10023248]|uniref:cytochrome c oxidase assembly protein n=1 Tax=Bacillales TaxID=1385 RepID=UPI002378418F|nr:MULTISPECIES: cytochrome c oxidase assembly protein [Bacillales]MDD9266780.1 cytochrome c oxidase assembly protein [Paenibacillus sp. MAHUQ-63]MDR6883725.1 putative membrane protein [Bacillus sp. 3255]